MFQVLGLALFVEAVVSALKPVWTRGEGLSVTELVSVGIGVLLAVALKIDLMSFISEYTLWDTPRWASYLFYAMSGVAIGRGPSFVYDLWESVRRYAEGTQG